MHEADANSRRESGFSKARRAHSTPDPDLPPPKPNPIPDDVPPPTHAPVQEPRQPEPPIKAN